MIGKMPDPVNPLSHLDPFSRGVVHLTMDFDGFTIATATGFLRRRSSELFLITAWHNLSGREPETLRPKHSQGSLPNYVRIEGFNFDSRLSLYSDNDPNYETHCSRRFWQHPQGVQVDVVVLRIPPPHPSIQPIDESFFIPNRNDFVQLWQRKAASSWVFRRA